MTDADDLTADNLDQLDQLDQLEQLARLLSIDGSLGLADTLRAKNDLPTYWADFPVSCGRLSADIGAGGTSGRAERDNRSGRWRPLRGLDTTAQSDLLITDPIHRIPRPAPHRSRSAHRPSGDTEAGAGNRRALDDPSHVRSVRASVRRTRRRPDGGARRSPRECSRVILVSRRSFEACMRTTKPLARCSDQGLYGGDDEI